MEKKLISYPVAVETKHTLKEQLRLFAFDVSPLPPRDSFNLFRKKMSKREKLVALLDAELNFHDEQTGYASHDFIHSLPNFLLNCREFSPMV